MLARTISDIVRCKQTIERYKFDESATKQYIVLPILRSLDWQEVNLKQRIFDIAYWKLKLQAGEDTDSIKYYLVTSDIDKTLKASDLPQQIGRSIIEVDIDGTYVLTAKVLEESDKVKLFEHFIDDLKQVIGENQ